MPGWQEAEIHDDGHGHVTKELKLVEKGSISPAEYDQVVSDLTNFLVYVDCADSHRVRIVLAEKDITVDILNVNPDDKPEDLAELNPYNTTPTLIDRDLVLYDARIIMEYLDERFPHPPLMPVDPVTRAHSRLALYRIERDWFSL
ncbi:unnamed protein product, partial [Cyprideis torosa]